MSRSKEEILEKEERLSGPYLTTDVVDRADALIAMDIYANEQSREVAIGFAEWVDRNNYVVDKSNKDKSINGKWYSISGVTEGELNLTSKELFDLYIIQSKTKEP